MFQTAIDVLAAVTGVRTAERDWLYLRTLVGREWLTCYAYKPWLRAVGISQVQAGTVAALVKALLTRLPQRERHGEIWSEVPALNLAYTVGFFGGEHLVYGPDTFGSPHRRN